MSIYQDESDIIIIGGGLAGLTNAIHLSRKGLKVKIIEKDSIPRHKVCGEYISNEVLPYLNWLGIIPANLHAVEIKRLLISSLSGKSITSQLDMGGFGLSRFAFDQALLQQAIKNGCILITDTVKKVHLINDIFHVSTLRNGVLKAHMALGAYGKKSVMDQKIRPQHSLGVNSWLAVKAHYSADFDKDLVALHQFNGGYCGVSNIENDRLNICYLVDYVTFKKFKNLRTFQKEVVEKNLHMKELFNRAEILWEKPLSIAQLTFEQKSCVENGLLLTGDSAGTIHPLCGNGMAMALQSSKIASDLIIKYYQGQISSIEKLNLLYKKEWADRFKLRLAVGKRMSSILHNQLFSEIGMHAFSVAPSILSSIIKHSHGRVMDIPV